MDLTIEAVVNDIRTQYRERPPNGWLLGWERERYLLLVQEACAPHAVVNATSFDYAFCNRYEVNLSEGDAGIFYMLAVRLSFIAPVFSLHWTRYESQTKGSVVSSVPSDCSQLEEKLRKTLERAGLTGLPDEWFEQEVSGVELELSGTSNVTIGKCLFEDYEG
ncbi:MAG: hypothetical protein H6815_12470 [Phycisphaeraceae bacterium]|nr:hypothetical protein [Phycisphaerales bacterium]MCB9861255.1 hypothetical protein [Phycisphaeraceae bacterium]